MPLEFGRSGFIRSGEESSYGSSSGSKTVFSRINSASLQSVQERERKTFLSHSSAAFQAGHFDVFNVVGGSLEMPLFYGGSGLFLPRTPRRPGAEKPGVPTLSRAAVGSPGDLASG